jgi:hypothetical protein
VTTLTTPRHVLRVADLAGSRLPTEQALIHALITGDRDGSA